MDADDPDVETQYSEEQEIAAILEALEDLKNGRLVPLREYDREFRERHNIPRDDIS